MHSNDEKTLEKIVPSPLSFGAEQKFSFKHEQTKQTISVVRTWQLLIIKDATQTNWLHR